MAGLFFYKAKGSSRGAHIHLWFPFNQRRKMLQFSRTGKDTSKTKFLNKD